MQSQNFMDTSTELNQTAGICMLFLFVKMQQQQKKTTIWQAQSDQKQQIFA